MSPGPFDLCRPRFACKALAVLVLLVASGCEREEGESCQTKRDCADGLICANIASERGVCIRPEDIELDAGRMDASEPDITEDDGGQEDAALDATLPGDTGTPDAGTDAATGDDAGSDDAGG